MKNHTLLLLLIIPFISLGQEIGDDRYGISLGTTNYIMDTNFLSSKSSQGFLIGVSSGIPIISDRLEVLTELNYNYHRVKFVGRETETSQPKDLNFNLQNIGVSALVHYVYLETDRFNFGINLGPTATFLYEFDTKESNSDFLIDPLLLETRYLKFDTENEEISFNAFLSLGLSAQYKNFMINLRYYKGITKPYRKAPVFSSFQELKGKDNYWSFMVTYFL